MPNEQAQLTRADMINWFAKAERTQGQLIGTELEKFGLYIGDGSTPAQPVNYTDHIAPLLSAMSARFGWQPGDDSGVSGEMVSLTRNGASITLEPGGQFELSGAPLGTLHETCAEFTQHYRELDEVARPLGLSFIASGFHPFATREEINWMPKGRYQVMRDYLPTKGSLALDMMTRTCTVQANYDFASEKQCGERFRLAMATSSLFTAIFANSPYVEGEHRGLASSRSNTWTDVDNDRCGLLEFVFDGSEFHYERYVDWALTIPMFFVQRNGEYYPHHVPFSDFVDNGFTDPQGKTHRATQDDWFLHLSTLFPEVRLKPYIEIRGADSVSSQFICAAPALGKGILYDEDTTQELWEKLQGFTFAQRLELWDEARRLGMNSPRIHEMCVQLVDASRRGLERLNVLDAQGDNEAKFLDRLQEMVHRGVSPAEQTLQELGHSPGRSAEARLAYARHYHFAGVKP